MTYQAPAPQGRGFCRSLDFCRNDRQLGNMTDAVKQLIERQKAVLAALPPFERIWLTFGLYEPLPLNGSAEYVRRLWSNEHQFDAHCVECGRSSTFRSEYYPIQLANSALLSDRSIARVFQCQRDTDHEYQYEFRIHSGKLIKIGQFPSLADIGSAEIQRFKPVLKGGLYGDLNRASGLFTHGVGAGALVYLRRIFERIIADERDAARADGIALEGFETLRLTEKIDALKERLPKSIHAHKRAYSLLSAGIHDLSEDQCRALFPVLKAVIVLILDEHLRAKEQQRAEAELSAALLAAESSLV